MFINASLASLLYVISLLPCCSYYYSPLIAASFASHFAKTTPPILPGMSADKTPPTAHIAPMMISLIAFFMLFSFLNIRGY
jgi:hypothetical protein